MTLVKIILLFLFISTSSAKVYLDQGKHESGDKQICSKNNFPTKMYTDDHTIIVDCPDEDLINKDRFIRKVSEVSPRINKTDGTAEITSWGPDNLSVQVRIIEKNIKPFDYSVHAWARREPRLISHSLNFNFEVTSFSLHSDSEVTSSSPSFDSKLMAMVYMDQGKSEKNVQVICFRSDYYTTLYTNAHSVEVKNNNEKLSSQNKILKRVLVTSSMSYASNVTVNIIEWGRDRSSAKNKLMGEKGKSFNFNLYAWSRRWHRFTSSSFISGLTSTTSIFSSEIPSPTNFVFSSPKLSLNSKIMSSSPSFNSKPVKVCLDEGKLDKDDQMVCLKSNFYPPIYFAPNSDEVYCYNNKSISENMVITKVLVTSSMGSESNVSTSITKWGRNHTSIKVRITGEKDKSLNYIVYAWATLRKKNGYIGLHIASVAILFLWMRFSYRFRL